MPPRNVSIRHDPGNATLRNMLIAAADWRVMMEWPDHFEVAESVDKPVEVFEQVQQLRAARPNLAVWANFTFSYQFWFIEGQGLGGFKQLSGWAMQGVQPVQHLMFCWNLRNRCPEIAYINLTANPTSSPGEPAKIVHVCLERESDLCWFLYVFVIVRINQAFWSVILVALNLFIVIFNII